MKTKLVDRSILLPTIISVLMLVALLVGGIIGNCVQNNGYSAVSKKLESLEEILKNVAISREINTKQQHYNFLVGIDQIEGTVRPVRLDENGQIIVSGYCCCCNPFECEK